MQQVLKDILSVKGLIMLIALVALGLSITAVVRGCGDDFGNVGDLCECPPQIGSVECGDRSQFHCDCSHPTRGIGQCVSGPAKNGNINSHSSSCTTKMGRGKICTTPTCTSKEGKLECSIPPCEIDVKKNYNPSKHQWGTCIDNSDKSKQTCEAYDQCDDPDDCVGCPYGFECKKADKYAQNKSCQEKSTSSSHARHATGFGPGGNIGTNTTTGHRRTAKHPTRLGFGEGGHGEPPNTLPSAVVNITPPPPPPSSDGGFPEWATITLSSVGGVLLLGLVIYLLMRMKHGNKLM